MKLQASVLLLLAIVNLISAFKKEGETFYKSFPGKCSSRTNRLDQWLELPHHCVSFGNRKMSLSRALDLCSDEDGHSKLLTVESTRKFGIVDFAYFAKGKGGDGPFWVNAEYHGSGHWTHRRSKRSIQFDYFPQFDRHRAHEGEALVWNPELGRLTAAHPDEEYEVICESPKHHVERCGGEHGECTNRGDCIESECYCDFPFFGQHCQYFGCSPKCGKRLMCDLSRGDCVCPPYLDDDTCTKCENPKLRIDNTVVCYVVGPTGVPYAAAANYCAAMGMSLAELVTDIEVSNAVSMKPASKIWLGAQYKPAPDAYYWNSGPPVDQFNNLVAINSSSIANCVKMAVPDGAWGNVDCSGLKPYVCQIPYTPPSAGGPTLSCMPGNNPCYLMVKTPTKNFADAKADCAAKGGTLALIKSQAQYDFIFALFPPLTTGGVWIGIQRDATTKLFTYLDGSVLPIKPNWATGEPTTPFSSQQCLTLDTATSKMSNNDCNLATFDTLCESPHF